MADTQPIPVIRDDPDPDYVTRTVLRDLARDGQKILARWGDAGDGERERLAGRIDSLLHGLAWCFWRLEETAPPRPPRGRHAAPRHHLRLVPPPRDSA